MAQYSNLKAYIEEKIYENGTQAITGDILQDVLKVMTDDLGEFYQTGGVASPSTDPGTPDAKVIYIATEAGSYTNFGGIELAAGEVALLVFDTTWTKVELNVLSAANGGVKTANLADGAVTTAKIANGAVEEGKIADASVTSGKLGSGAVTTEKIADGAATTDKIADKAVATGKLGDKAVTSGKIADKAVGTGQVADEAITEGKIADAAVTSDKIAENAVTTAKINNGAVIESKIQEDAVKTAKIGSKAVTTAKIADKAVTSGQLGDKAVTTDKIADGAVGSDQLAEGAFSAQNLADGSVTTEKIADDAITAEKIADGAVTAGKFADGSVTTAKIGSAAVTTEKIGDGAVSRRKIGDGAVTTAKLDDEAVTTAKIDDGAVTTAKIDDGAVTTDKIADANVTTAKIADANVTTGKLADSAVATAKIADENVTTGKLADAAVTTAKINDGAVTTGKIADGNVTGAKLQEGVRPVINVNALNEETAAYGSAALARAAVPSALRILGLHIIYLLADGWFEDEYIGSNVSGWGTASNWRAVGPVSVSQNTSTGHTDITIGDETTPVASADEAEKLKYNVDGVNNSYEFSLVASTGLSFSLNSKMFAGNRYTMKMTTANTMVIYVRLDYTDGTTEGANRATNEDITITPSKDVTKLRLTASVSTDVVLTIKADSKFDDLNAELSDKINGTDNIARLYPFTTSIDKTLTRPGYDTQIVYSKALCGIQFLLIDTYSDEKFYFSTLYSYGSQTSVLNIRNESDDIHFTYSAQRSSLSNRPVETLNLTADDNESTLKIIIDWSKINTSTGQGLNESFTIDESCIHRKQREFSINPYLDKTFSVNDKAADSKTLGGIARLYPFVCPLNSVLTRPSYPDQIVYDASKAGIKYLFIKTKSQLPFYVRQLYAYANTQRSYITIQNSDESVKFFYESEVRASSSSSSFPTETIELTTEDGSYLKAVIDWSIINRATGINLDESTYQISEECILRQDSYCDFLPLSDYYVTGEQQRIYMNEIAEYDKGGFFRFQASGNTGQEVISGWNGECQYLQFNVTSTKDITVTISYYGKYNLIATKTITVHAVVGATLPQKKYMFIGDSLTYAGIFEKKFYDMNNGQVTLYGTVGTAPYLHEGRHGWKSSDYLTKASFNGQTNAFWNPESETFDFSYYMANNPSFADVDCVVIFLGRNDGYSSGSLITNINTMIASIKAFNSNIKCYVIGAYNVACNDSGTGKYLQSHSAMNHIGFNYNKNKFYQTFTQLTETKPIAVHLNLDNKYDYSSTLQDVSVVDDRKIEVYTDNVHPSNIGYEKFGMAINGFFHNEFHS